MQTMDWQPGPRVVSGPDSINLLGEIARDLNARRTMIVSDPGVAAAGHVTCAERSLRDHGIDVAIMAETHPNPSSPDITVGVAAAAAFQPDLLVGLGGGSAMDCAKGVNFVHTNGGQIEDYWGYGKTSAPMLPMIAIPTTAGTGSEMQSYALITRLSDHRKMACGDRGAMPRAAILEPRLLLTVPRNVAALAAVDAVSHAVESYVSTNSTLVSRMYSRESFQLLSSAIKRLRDAPTDLEAWSTMQWGAALAGMAIENSMLGAAHALANPLTAHFDLPHGQAVGVMLPHVVRFNATNCASQYAELTSHADGIADLALWLTEQLNSYGVATSLRALGVNEQQLGTMAEEAANQWTSRFNPRAFSSSDAIALYQAAF